MARPRRVSDERIADALREHRGVITHAAEAVGLSLCQMQNRIRKSPELQKLVHEFRRSVAEKALAKLAEHLERGEPWAIRYILRRFGHYVGLDLPPVHIAPNEDPTDVLGRLDAIEAQLIGQPITLREALALVDLRRQLLVDSQRTGDLGPVLDMLVTEVSRAIESVIHDPHIRAQLARELAEAFQRAAGRAPRS